MCLLLFNFVLLRFRILLAIKKAFNKFRLKKRLKWHNLVLRKLRLLVKNPTCCLFLYSTFSKMPHTTDKLGYLE